MNAGSVKLATIVGADAKKRGAVMMACGVSEQTVRNWVSGAGAPHHRYRQILFDLHGIEMAAWDAPPRKKRGAQ